LEGQQLQRWIASSEDQRRFESHLSSAKMSESSMPQVFNVILRDSMQQPVEAEIFIVSFDDLKGCKRFLIGIKEACERLAPLAPMRHFKKKVSVPSPRRQRDMSHSRGTPPAADTQQLPGDENAAADEVASDGNTSDEDVDGAGPGQASHPRVPSSRSSCSRSSGRLVRVPCYPGLPLTTPRSIRAVLLEALYRINVPVKATMCCSRHAVAHAMREALEDMQDTSCGCMARECEAQCRACGVLGEVPHGDEVEGGPPWDCGICAAVEVKPIRELTSL